MSVRITGRLRLEPIGPEHAHDVWLERIGMTYAGPWDYKGLPGAEFEAVAGERGAAGRRDVGA